MRRSLIVFSSAILVFGAILIGYGGSASADQEPSATSAAHLMDRGTTPAADSSSGTRANNTLAVGAATPMASPGMSANPFLAPGYIVGNLFLPVVDFPTSWYPFWVTGAFAFEALTTNVTAQVGAAVVVPGSPLAVVTAQLGPMSPATSPGALIGGPGLWPGSPAGPLPVAPGQGVLAGALITHPMGGERLAGLAAPMSPRFANAALPTPMAPVFVPMMPSGEYIAGAFVSGATVPVELQAFHVE